MEETEGSGNNPRTDELGNLIAAPVIATVKADFLATRAFFRILERFCFARPGTEDLDPDDGADGDATNREWLRKAVIRFGKLRMVSFTFVHTDSQGFQVLTRVRIPLITLVPLPMLQIKRAEFNYDLQLVDRLEDEDNASDPVPSDLTKLPLRWKAAWAPLIEQTTTAEPLKANLRVRIDVEQADMPAGIAATLNLVNDGMITVPVGGSMEVSPAVMDVWTSNTKQQYLLNVRLKSASSVDLNEVEVAVQMTTLTMPNPIEIGSPGNAFDVFAIVGEVTVPWNSQTSGFMKVKSRNKGEVELAFFVSDPDLLDNFQHLAVRLSSTFNATDHEKNTIINLFKE